MTQPNTATCDHGLSTLIEPPTAEGWMRESCGCCGQILRWTLWPHHHRARVARSDDVAFCGDCGEEIAEADLAVDEDSGETWHLQCLDPVEQVRHLQSQPGRWSSPSANPSTA